jgi:hypothetical protein
VSKTVPSFGRRFKPAARRCPLSRKFGLDVRRWNQVASIGRVQADLHLATKPRVMIARLLLLLHEVPHEVPQKLGARAVPGFRGSGKLVLQSFIDPEGKRCVAHGSPYVLHNKCTVAQYPIFAQIVVYDHRSAS